MPRPHGRPVNTKRKMVQEGILAEAIKGAMNSSNREDKLSTPKDNGDSTSSTSTAANSNRSCGWRWRSEDMVFGILHIKNGSAEWDYFVTRLSKGIYTLTKLVPGATVAYTCSIPEKVEHRSCGCEGWKFNRKCKHIGALLSLKGRGLL